MDTSYAADQDVEQPPPSPTATSLLRTTPDAVSPSSPSKTTVPLANDEETETKLPPPTSSASPLRPSTSDPPTVTEPLEETLEETQRRLGFALGSSDSLDNGEEVSQDETN